MTAIPPTDIQEVMRHLPHRHPFVLVDFVEGGVAGEWVRVRKHVSVDAPYFAHAGAERPAMPHSLIVEAIAQAGGVLCFYSGLFKPLGGSNSYLAGIDETRFERPAWAGETLHLEVRLKRALRGVVRLAGRALVGDELVVEAQLTLVIRDSDPESVGDARNGGAPGT
ncbi:MAG: 3-hydroxyacyl-[acyl-carrier-protein] dehydratase FabZ [Burkholderiales bacterium]